MLADAFADMKTGRRIVEKMSEEKPNVAKKFLAFTKKLIEGVKNFCKSKEVKEKYPEVALTNWQFKNFVERIEKNVESLQKGKAVNSLGYKLLKTNYVHHSPYKFAPQKQKKFDRETASRLMKSNSAESVQKVIQELSPLGVHNKNYGAEIMREVNTNGR